MNYNFIRPDLIVGSCLQVFFFFFFGNLVQFCQIKFGHLTFYQKKKMFGHITSLIFYANFQTPEDVDKLRRIGVKTIFCLQQDPDLEYP